MSTVKVNEVRHLSNSGTANIVLESNANTNLQTTSTLGLGVTGTLTVSGVSTFNGNVQVGNASTDTMALTSTVSGFSNYSGFTGEIRMYAGDATGESASIIAKGWLFCNGNYIGKTSLIVGSGNHHNADGSGNDYEPLFNLLKATSDWQNTSSWDWDSNYVKLPDFRSRSPVGLHTGANNAIGTGSDAVALTALTLGDTSGKETHSLSVAELKNHSHGTTIDASVTGQAVTYTRPTATATQPQHRHTLAHTHPIPHTHNMSHNHGMEHHHNIATTETATTSSGSAHRHEYPTEGGADHNKTGGINASANSLLWAWTDYENSHTHYFNVPAHNTLASDTSVTGGSNTAATAGVNTANSSAASETNTSYQTPAITVTVAGGNATITNPTHTHAIATTDTGSGTAHTILSPIIAVNYIIKV